MPVVSRDEFGLRTSDPRSGALTICLSPEAPRQARLHVASFNGTLAGGLWSSRKTVVSEFVKLISCHENVVETPLNGVGTDGSWTDYILGGISGWGTLRNVVNALKNLSKGYLPGDRIILDGYSRGAWAARYLALLIYLIGLPKNGDERLFSRIYKACNNNTIWKEGTAAKLMNGYDCWGNVRINALCCFDTVGSFGLPLTGVAKPLSILRGWRKNNDVISDVAPNVDYAFHALALHEQREPFAPTLMRGDNILQVSFPGDHGNLGWIGDTEGLVHGPLAWMVQQAHTFLNIEFDEVNLSAQFPKYRPEGADEPADEPTWYKGEIERVNSGVLAIVGKKVRNAGRIGCANGLIDLKVHIGARLRNHGASESEDAVPGYALTAPVTGPPFWAQRLVKSRWSWSRTNSRSTQSSSSSDASSPRHAPRVGTCSPSAPIPRAADRIEEAPVGALEARCLGLPLSVVTISP